MSTVDVTTIPLSATESMRLVELEDVVIRGMDTFVAVGRALAEIQTSKLYRATHSTFAAYLEDHFELSRSRAYEMIAASETVVNLSAIGGQIPIPANERQARELAGLSGHVAAEVMLAADEATGGKPTATAIKDARNEMVAPRSSSRPTPSAPASPSRPAPAAPAPDEDEDDEDTLDSPGDLTDASFRLQMEERRLVSMERLRVAEAKGLSLIAATAVAELVEAMRRQREAVDPIQMLATELSEIYTDRSVEVIEQDVEAVLLAARRYYLDLGTVRRAVTAKYDRNAESRTVPGTAQVVIEVGSNTAVVVSGWPTVRSILERLGVRGMKDHRRGLMCFPAKYADDVQANAEFRRQSVQLVRHDDR